MKPTKFLFGPSVDGFINLVLESLTEREKIACIYRFGIGGHSTMTYEQIGKEMGCTRAWARQLVVQALYKIRRSPSSMRLMKSSRQLYASRHRSPAICKNRPPEWCMNKYHGAKDFE